MVLMRKIIFILTMLFCVLAIVGGIYVLCTGGDASPGYGILPLTFAVVGLLVLRKNAK